MYDPPLRGKKTLSFYNCTDSAVYYEISCLDSLDLNAPLFLFDTIQNGYNNDDCLCSIKSPNYRINAYMYERIELQIKNITKNCKDKKIRFFFIMESTMRKYNWREICKYQLYEKKLTFTQAELWLNNWVVVYE
jgi:hypothetical protein